MAYKLVLLRHGQSVWNKENKFTGWTDVSLSEEGEQQAKFGGQLIKEAGLEFDEVHTNLLKRCIKTMWIVLEEIDQMWLPIYRTWRLNERHYGALQGLNKSETAEKEGEEQVKIWRRSYDVQPPLLHLNDPRYPGNDRRYDLLEETDVPVGESLADTVARSLPYYSDHIAPKIMNDKKLLIVASGNSLRSIVKHLEDIPDNAESIMNINIPTGIPLVYELDERLNMLDKYYLGDEEKVKAAMEAVANQGKAQ